MKRFLLVAPMILVIILNACENPGTPTGGIFITFTPTFSPPPVPTISGPAIITNLNRAIDTAETITPIAELEHSMSAKYQVLDVTLQANDDGTTTFLIKVNCECAGNGQCCSHEQTFVEVMRAMYVNRDLITGAVSGTVEYVNVWCYDHSSQFVVVYASWDDVMSFLYGGLTGDQLASRVKHN